jgi:DNA replication protein DnaC
VPPARVVPGQAGRAPQRGVGQHRGEGQHGAAVLGHGVAGPTRSGTSWRRGVHHRRDGGLDVSAEVDDRAERRRERRIHEAKFPRLKRLADFDLGAAPTVDSATIATLASGAYLDAGNPVGFLGDSGTGKSHLLIGLGVAACDQGRRVRYVACAQLVNELVEAADDRRLSRIVARYGRLDLLCLDELAAYSWTLGGAELLFQIVTEREEKASIATGSNLPFSEWGSIIPDPRLVAAIVDRLTFHAHIIETGTESYRLRTTRASELNKGRRAG